MARRQYPSSYDSDPYGSGASPYDQFDGQRAASPRGGRAGAGPRRYGSDPYGSDPYGSDPYGSDAGHGQAGGYAAQAEPRGRSDRDPYGAGNQRGGYRQVDRRQGEYQRDDRASAGYRQEQGDPYGCGAAAAPGQRGGRSPYDRQGQGYSRGRSPRGSQTPASAYPVGSGRTYESSRADGAAGVQPVAGRGYVRSAPTPGGGAGNGGPGGPVRGGAPMDRRKFLAVAGAAAGAVVLGAAGVAWFTHRAVACTVNGSVREAPTGAKAQDLVDRGYAYPSAGNLVSIPDADGNVEVLTVGGGNPYTVTVNGEVVDRASWRLSEGDVIEFSNGTDVTEDVTRQTTEIPCGIQMPGDEWYLNSIGYVKQWGANGISTVETGLVSGRTIDRGVTQEPRDLIIERSRVNPADGRLLVALTFDDGPSLEYTPQYLDILARYGAKATFFNLGSTLTTNDEYRAMCKRCVDEGHQMASHTWSHDDTTLTGMDDATRAAEIKDTFDAIGQATGVPTEVMRPPFGEFRASGFLTYLRQTGNIAYSAYWTVDSEDWTLPGADAIVYNCTRGLAGDNYNGAIILMHDGGGNRDQDVQALPSIIETFQNAGYQFVTMNELLASDPTFPAWVSAGTVERPEGAIVPDASAEVTYATYNV